MRDEWKSKPLGEVTIFLNGLWKGEKPPFITVGVIRNTNFAKDGSIDDSDIAWLDVEAKKFEKRKLKLGDIILEKSGGGPKQPVGRVALFEKEEGDYSFSNFTSAIRVNDPRELDFRFLHKFLFWKYTSGVTESMQSHSTGIRNLNAEAYKDIAVPLPPLPEQQRIVAILDEAFAGLVTATANAEKNLKNARELFESYLSFILTQTGATWEKRKLSEVAREFGRGKSKHRPRNDPKLYGGPYPFVQTGDISNADHWLTDYTQTYSAFGVAQSRLWPKGTVCIAIVGATVGETAILNFEACFPDSVIGIVVDEKIADAEYVEYLLQSFKAFLKEKGKGTARDNINLGTFENQLFPFPALKEQRLIVDRLNQMASRKRDLEEFYTKRLTAISELRQSILQKAFSGELTSPLSRATKQAAE
ncbi:restriction endonuclease subunit S [Bradyrhizobium elkanii]|uniref:restriction endonuclease subunit S n=1 Tax=Bradyrhizobium elkanii TaxID=29448 RepID=UPI000428397C|nr:restriction endonuclease subunit S [Bradyrhizobium elkanii]